MVKFRFLGLSTYVDQEKKNGEKYQKHSAHKKHISFV